MKRSLVAFTLLLACSMTARADESVMFIRTDLAKSVAAVFDAPTSADVLAIVNDAQSQMAVACEQATIGLRQPAAILDNRQKRALMIAQFTHETPHLELRADQRDALTAYGRAVALAAAPILSVSGARIERIVSSAQRQRLAQLRETASMRLRRAAQAADEPLAATFLTTLPTSVGAFVLLVELDPKAIVGGLR